MFEKKGIGKVSVVVVSIFVWRCFVNCSVGNKDSSSVWWFYCIEEWRWECRDFVWICGLESLERREFCRGGVAGIFRGCSRCLWVIALCMYM